MVRQVRKNIGHMSTREQAHALVGLVRGGSSCGPSGGCLRLVITTREVKRWGRVNLFPCDDVTEYPSPMSRGSSPDGWRYKTTRVRHPPRVCVCVCARDKDSECGSERVSRRECVGGVGSGLKGSYPDIPVREVPFDSAQGPFRLDALAHAERTGFSRGHKSQRHSVNP